MGIDEAESRLRCPSSHLGRRGRALDLQVQEIAEEDGLLAVGTRTAEADHPAEAIAVRAALLAEVAGLALWALINGVRGQGRSAAQGFAEQSFLQVRERRVA